MLSVVVLFVDSVWTSDRCGQAKRSSVIHCPYVQTETQTKEKEREMEKQSDREKKERERLKRVIVRALFVIAFAVPLLHFDSV